MNTKVTRRREQLPERTEELPGEDAGDYLPLDLALESQVSAILANFGEETSNALHVDIFSAEPNQDEVFLTKLPANKASLSDLQSRFPHGGRFRIRGYYTVPDADGARRARLFINRIERIASNPEGVRALEERKAQEERERRQLIVAPPQPAPTTELALILKGIQDGQAALANAISLLAQRGTTGGDNRKDWLTEMKLMAEIFRSNAAPQSNGGGSRDLKDVLSLARDIAKLQNGGGESDGLDLIAKALEMFGPQIAAAGARRGAVPSRRLPNPTPEQPAQDNQPMLWQIKLLGLINTLAKRAAQGRSAEDYVDFALDELESGDYPADIIETLRVQWSSPTWFEELQRHAPAIASHRAFFEKLKSEFMELTGPEATDDNATVPSGGDTLEGDTSVLGAALGDRRDDTQKNT